MSIIKVVYSSEETEDYISTLWNMMRFVRNIHDEPQMWKLTDPFLEAITQFLNFSSKEEVLCSRFLDTPVDITRQAPYIICELSKYPLQIVGYVE